MKSKILSATSAAFLLASGGLAFAADPPRPVVTSSQPIANAVGQTFRAKQILGTKILIRGGTSIGTVEDLVFDDAGNMEYLVVSTGDNRLITVPWDAAKFDLANKSATVNITQQVYKTIPTYTTTTYPQFYTPTYRTDIYKSYGLTPRQLRRLERRIP